MFAKRLALITATTAAAAAFAVPSAAQAASPCYVHLPGPGNTSWDVQTNGSLDTGLFNGGGQNFAKNHGRLAVNGVTYPAIDNQCTTTATSVAYPARSVGGMTVSRLVTVTGGRIRHLDTITNNSGQFKLVDVDFAAKVTAGQLSVAAETGGFEIDRHDHWAVFKSAGSTYPALQWGTDDSSAHDPDILSDNPDSPSIWRPSGPSMPSATLKYDGIQIGTGQTIRVLHVSSSTASLADGTSVAQDRLTPFSGFSKATASTIVNWGDDPDKDGVTKFTDACPAIKGNTANGCLLDVPVPPVDPQDPGEQPAPADPGNPVDPGNPSDPSNPGSADTTAPTVTVTKLSKAVRRARVGRLAPRIRCNEACRVSVLVQVTRKGHKKATTVLSTKPSSLSSAARTVKLKVRAGTLKSLRRQRVTVRVTARDAAGNARTVTRTVTLRK